jgi:hypothetical protein
LKFSKAVLCSGLNKLYFSSHIAKSQFFIASYSCLSDIQLYVLKNSKFLISLKCFFTLILILGSNAGFSFANLEISSALQPLSSKLLNSSNLASSSDLICSGVGSLISSTTGSSIGGVSATGTSSIGTSVTTSQLGIVLSVGGTLFQYLSSIILTSFPVISIAGVGVFSTEATFAELRSSGISIQALLSVSFFQASITPQTASQIFSNHLLTAHQTISAQLPTPAFVVSTTSHIAHQVALSTLAQIFLIAFIHKSFIHIISILLN